MGIVVIGGGGYIGSHMVRHLLDREAEIFILDNFCTGFPDAVLGGEIVRGEMGDIEVLNTILSRKNIDAVMLFAGSINVGESTRDPAKYYQNNVVAVLAVLQAMVRHRVPHLIFSSSAAVYGDVADKAIHETQKCEPISPYGKSKRIIELALEDFAAAYEFSFCALRYFNAAGAAPDGLLGERHDPETHLIPLVLQAASGRRACIHVFGRNYPTADGTCIRDYIHVDDLCEAHWLALSHLRKGGEGGFYNLGNSRGYSVAEVIDAARHVTSRSIAIEDAPSRAGDPAVLLACADKAHAALGWQPRFASLEIMIEHAWRWELKKGDRW